MDPATEALESRDHSQPINFTALSKSSKVSRTTIRARYYGRNSAKQRSEAQQYLTPQEETALADYALRMDRRGHPLTGNACRAIAYQIRLRRPSSFQIAPDNSSIDPPKRSWFQGFRRRTSKLKAVRQRLIPAERDDAQIYDKIVEWFAVLGEVLSEPDVLTENIYNMDETGVMLGKLNSVKVLVSREDMKKCRGSGVNRTTITAIECVSADGRYLHPLIIWPASTHRNHWTTHPTPAWHYGLSAKGYTDTALSLYWMQHVFDPLTKDRAGKKPRVLVNDGFGTHESPELLEFCYKNNIILCRLPSHTSHKLQPCDIGVFSPLKHAYREEVEKLFRCGAGTIGLKHFTLLYDRARRRAFNRRNILKGYSEAGLSPLNPRKVFDKMQKPVANINDTSTPSNTGTSTARVLHDIEQPPETPTTSDALTRLCQTLESALAKSNSLDPDTRTRVRKLTKAAQGAFADRLIMLNENEELFEQNCEKAVRESANANVVGKAKVMKYEDIHKAKQLREQKELKKQAGRGRRGKKQQQDIPQSADPDEDREKEIALQEIRSSGLEQFCGVMEF